jgi:hypothetical protein
MAMVEPVTLVGGMVNSAPAAFIRSYSRCTSVWFVVKVGALNHGAFLEKGSSVFVSFVYFCLKTLCLLLSTSVLALR